MAHRGRRNADEALALAVATGQCLRDAAQAIGVSERTAARRWADTGFRQRVSELRAEMVQRSLGRMADGMAEAADVLRKLLTANSESIRLGAARCLLDLGVRLREAVEVEERLLDLEQEMERRRTNQPPPNGRGAP